MPETNQPVNLDVNTVLTRYMRELTAMTQRALIAEATVEALQTMKEEEPASD